MDIKDRAVQFLSSIFDTIDADDDFNFSEVFEHAFLQQHDDANDTQAPEDVCIGPEATMLSSRVFHEIGARIAREGTLTVARDNGTYVTLRNGQQVSSLCRGQRELPDHNGPMWADIMGRTLLKLPDDMCTEHVHHVIATRTQQYDGRYWGRDDDLKYIGSHMEVVTVSDSYVDSIIESGALDYGTTSGGNDWYSNPHNRRYDENGKLTNVGLSAWDGEIALVYSVHPDDIGILPPDVYEIMDTEHGFVHVAGADIRQTGDPLVHASTIIAENDLREAIDSAEAAISKSLEVTTPTATSDDVNKDLLTDDKSSGTDYTDNFTV